MKDYKDLLLGILVIWGPILLAVIVLFKACSGGGGVPEELHPTRQYHGGGEQ
jgi:hypothetical protein